MNGVIDLITGLLIMAGYCEFDFDPLTQDQIPNVPYEFYLINDPYNPDSPTITHWTGTDWDEVPRV